MQSDFLTCLVNITVRNARKLESVFFFINTGLLLMGFKPRSSLKNYYHIRPAQFLYPSEKVGMNLVMLMSSKFKQSFSHHVTLLSS